MACMARSDFQCVLRSAVGHLGPWTPLLQKNPASMSCVRRAVRHLFEVGEPAKTINEKEGTMSTATEEAPTQNASCQEMPGPVEEHGLLQKFVGEWESEGEAFMAPGQPPTKLKGVESSRMIGGFWFVAQIKSTVPDFPYEQILTLGYDPVKKKHVGTVIDSMTSHIWQLEGTFDATGNVLTWETEGPVPDPKTPSKFREVTELKSPNHKVFTSSLLGPDGSWNPVMTINLRRKT
jgi:Protein of unknown function (DUF1579)